MTHRNIEEVFREVAPTRTRGIPGTPVLTTGVSGASTDLGQSLTQAGQEIGQLRQSYQQQVDFITANTQALQGNTAAQASHSTSSALGGIASRFLHGITGIVSPIFSGIAHLFGGGSSSPEPLPVYKAPPSIAIDAILGGPSPSSGVSTGSPGSGGTVGSFGNNISTGLDIGLPAGPGQVSGAGSSVTSNITVHVNAMDSQSFMDRSSDIASAVREAMLNNHPINSVVADL